MKFELDTVNKTITILEPVKLADLLECFEGDWWEEYTIQGKVEYVESPPAYIPYYPYPVNPPQLYSPTTPYPIITWCTTNTANAIHT